MTILRQETLPRRLTFVPLGWKTENPTSHSKIMVYKGFLSEAPHLEDCFGDYDHSLEFFLHIDWDTRVISVHPKL